MGNGCYHLIGDRWCSRWLRPRCNQDARTIERAVQLAAETARGYAHENRQRAETELQQIIAQRPQVPR